MKNLRLITYLVFVALLISCSLKKKEKVFSVKNSLDINRSFETIEIERGFLNVTNFSSVGIKNLKTGAIEVTQLVDIDGDGNIDQLLFQPQVAANSEIDFQFVNITEAERPKAQTLCYSRFVPERTDDYTWENNKVAFRVYGPIAQKMVEDGISGGTLSSGVDAWLKRVEYPIINKWYKKYTDGTGSYHQDTGEGLDDFHVGVSRGIGGIAVKKNDTYYFSKNYTKWRTITNGPIRTSFYLEYEDWDASGKKIKESKTISLDLGNNFSKFSTNIEGNNQISVGLTLHKNKGTITNKINDGWLSHWEPHTDSEIGSAIITAKNTITNYEKVDSEIEDLNNVYVQLNVKNNQVIYYAGFGWKKSKQFNSKEDWENYVAKFSLQINNPLEVKIIQ
jgi:hypothetical protein